MSLFFFNLCVTYINNFYIHITSFEIKKEYFKIICIYSFGVVVAFVTNNYFHQGVQNATTSAREGVDDSQKFLKSTSFQVNHLLVTNYDDLSGNLNVMLDGQFVVFDLLNII